jgi:hypothetical protein
MFETFAALAPIFLVIAIGVGARHWPVTSEAFWTGAERLTYFVLFPALLVARLSANPIPAAGVLPTIAALIGPVLVLSALLPILKPVLRMSGADFATFLMASIRFNTYAGLAGSVALFGAEGLAVFAILLAVYIPIVNVISCLALGRWAAPAAATPRYIALAIVTNPLVLACVAGIALNLAGITLPEAAGATLDIMGKAALGLGLLCVGASLRWRALVESRWPIAGAVLVKLVVLPIFAGLACHLIGISGVERAVVILFAALPASPAAFVLARQMGGNAPMMAGIITTTTPLAMITIPIALALLA